MNAKHITKLTIENFRGFEKLELEGLQAVNLIVGQNNAGKTSLLEAIAMVAEPARLGELPQRFRVNVGNVHERFFRWLLRDNGGVESGSVTIQGEGVGSKVLIYAKPAKSLGPGFKKLFEWPHLTAYGNENRSDLKVRVSSVQHPEPQELVKSFGDAVRPRAGEELIHRILKAVDSRITRVRVDPAQDGNIIMVDIGLSESIPLTQAGQGVYRLISILSDLIGEKPKVCVIDEIENGIHHTVLKQVWRGLAEISETMGVQIFATTHSEECLEAAHEVFFAEDKQNLRDFAVIQLMRVKDQVVGKVLNEARVEAALENEIELR